MGNPNEGGTPPPVAQADTTLGPVREIRFEEVEQQEVTRSPRVKQKFKSIHDLFNEIKEEEKSAEDACEYGEPGTSGDEEDPATLPR